MDFRSLKRKCTFEIPESDKNQNSVLSISKKCLGLDLLSNFTHPISMNSHHLARSAVTEPTPPATLSPALKALWLAKAGKWEESHDLCQTVPGPAGSWIHAWLHREEGDQSNAEYWYGRAGKPVPPKGQPLAEEWAEIVDALSAD